MGAAPARDENLRTLYLLIVTQGFSTLGSQMSAYAVGLWLFQRTGSTAYLLLVPFFREFPAMLSASVAGAAVDRWSRKLHYIASSISFLAIGPLVDRVLEPAVSSPGWSRIAPIVGAHPGAGMGLVFAATGVIMLVVSVLAYCSPGVRQLEAQVADWEGETIVS